MHGFEEKRQFTRTDYIAQVKITKKSANEDYLSTTKNIGLGGVCVALTKDIGVFSEVLTEVSLKDKSQDPFICEGKVVWVIKRAEKDSLGQDVYDTGVEFVKLSDEHKERINSIIKQ